MRKGLASLGYYISAVSVPIAIVGFGLGLISGLGVFLSLIALVMSGISMLSGRIVFGLIVFPLVTIGLLFSVLSELANSRLDILLFVLPFYGLFFIFFLLRSDVNSN